MEKYTSKYYTAEDTECHCGCGFNPVNPLLLEKLDQLCDLVGVKLELNSVCRCAERNAEVGGAALSQHVLGNAADVACPDVHGCDNVETLAELAEQVGFDAIGIYPDEEFVHCDVRDNGENPGGYTW